MAPYSLSKSNELRNSIETRGDTGDIVTIVVFDAQMRSLLKNPRVGIPLTITLVAAIAWLAFGYFGVHLLFTDDRVSEAAPVFDVPTATTVSATDDMTDDMTDDTAMTTDAMTDDTAMMDETTTVPAPTIVTEATGSFVSRDHPTSGTALVLGNGTGQRFLRFEEFATDNGPDVNVYLVNSAAGGVSDIVDLGDLKGNIGDQNYEIPAGVDLTTYDTVLLWCVRFSSPFGEALLTSA